MTASVDQEKFAQELDRMRNRIERLRGLCKTAVGYLRDCERDDFAEEIAALIGDMEPPDSGSSHLGSDCVDGASKTALPISLDAIKPAAWIIRKRHPWGSTLGYTSELAWSEQEATDPDETAAPLFAVDVPALVASHKRLQEALTSIHALAAIGLPPDPDHAEADFDGIAETARAAIDSIPKELS